MNSEIRQALAELLLLAPYVDAHLSVLEDDVVEKAMILIGWDPGNPEELCSAQHGVFSPWCSKPARTK